MILNSKEKWVVDRLKRQGWRTDTHFMSYSPDQCLLWLPGKVVNTSFDWCGRPFFYMDRRKGLWLHFRPKQNPAMHLTYHISWLTLKNWDKSINPFLQMCAKLNDDWDLMNFEKFSEKHGASERNSYVIEKERLTSSNLHGILLPQ